MSETIATTPADFDRMLSPGETRIFCDERTGITIKVFAFMGGGFTRVDVRNVHRVSLPMSETFMHEDHALNHAAKLVGQLLTAAAEAGRD